MATYVNDLRLKEITTGDESGTWGTSTNTNLELIAEAFSYGTEVITTNADTHTTTIADGSTDPGRSLYLKYTGTLDSACTITIGPDTVSKVWIIENGTSGSQNIIISQGSGANITIPAGDTKVVYSDGAGAGAAFFDAFASLSVVDLKVQDDLTVTDDASVGGDLTITGASTAATYNGIASKTFGTSSIMIGDTTTGTISAANYNTGLGVDVFAALTRAGDALTEGGYNVAVGYTALGADTLGSKSVALGNYALALQNFTSATDTYNTAVGHLAGYQVTTGLRNTLIGGLAGDSTTTASDNTAVGYGALGENTTGDQNTAVGSTALTANSTGNYNTAVGYASLTANIGGTQNASLGSYSMDANTSGNNNSGLGHASISANTTGSGAGSLVTTGGDNTFVGNQAGDTVTTGQQLTIIGGYSDANATIQNATAIGYNTNVTATNNIFLGNTSVSAIKGQVSFSTYSDERIKKDIKDTDLGLEFIKELKPRKYKRVAPKDYPEEFKDPNKDDLNNPDYIVDGLVAQEVKQTMDKLDVSFSGWDEDENTTKQSLEYPAFVPALIKAIQELSTQVDELKSELLALKGE
jgi:trimeric autotransporter adhesin